MPWVWISFLLLSALAGELFYLLLAALADRGLASSSLLAPGQPHSVGGENGSSKKCSGLLTQCGQGQNHTGLGLQALNGVKLLLLKWWLRWWCREIAPGWVWKAASSFLPVCVPCCLRLPLKGLTSAAGARVQAHSPRAGQWHCTAAAVAIHWVCFDTHVPHPWHHPCHGLPREWIGQKAPTN